MCLSRIVYLDVSEDCHSSADDSFDFLVVGPSLDYISNQKVDEGLENSRFIVLAQCLYSVYNSISLFMRRHWSCYLFYHSSFTCVLIRGNVYFKIVRWITWPIISLLTTHLHLIECLHICNDFLLVARICILYCDCEVKCVKHWSFKAFHIIARSSPLHIIFISPVLWW